MHLIRSYLKILLKATAARAEEHLDTTLKNAFTHASGPPLERGAAEKILEELCVEGMVAIARPKNFQPRQLPGSALYETFRLAQLAPDVAVRSASQMLRTMGSVVRNVVVVARRAMEAEARYLGEEDKPVVATQQEELLATAKLVGISRALKGDAAGLNASARSRARDNGKSSKSSVPDTTLQDLEMVCRLYELRIPQCVLVPSQTIEEMFGVLDPSDPNGGPSPLTGEYHTKKAHERFLYAYNKRDEIVGTDSLYVKYSDGEAQTNLRGDVAPAHLSSALKLELEQAQYEMKQLREELKTSKRRNTLLNEEATANARREQLDHIRKSVFYASGKFPSGKRKSVSPVKFSLGRKSSDEESSNGDSKLLGNSTLKSSLSFHFGTPESEMPGSSSDPTGEQLVEYRRRTLLPTNELDHRQNSQAFEGNPEMLAKLKEIEEAQREGTKKPFETFLSDSQLEVLQTKIDGEFQRRVDAAEMQGKSPRSRKSPGRSVSPQRSGPGDRRSPPRAATPGASKSSKQTLKLGSFHTAALEMLPEASPSKHGMQLVSVTGGGTVSRLSSSATSAMKKGKPSSTLTVDPQKRLPFLKYAGFA